jgi:hypothetical protein
MAFGCDALAEHVVGEWREGVACLAYGEGFGGWR